MAMASAERGRLIRNTSRHDTESINHPPTKGPSAVVMAPSPDQVPMARARSSGWNEAEIMARLPGTSRAAAAPWRSRATMSRSAVGATAHSAEVEREAGQADHEDLAAAEEVAEGSAQDEQ